MSDLLAAYPTDHVMAETLSDIQLCAEGQSSPAAVYSDVLCLNVLCLAQMGNEAQLRGVLIDGLRPSIRLSMREY